MLVGWAVDFGPLAPALRRRAAVVWGFEAFARDGLVRFVLRSTPLPTSSGAINQFVLVAASIPSGRRDTPAESVLLTTTPKQHHGPRGAPGQPGRLEGSRSRLPKRAQSC